MTHPEDLHTPQAKHFKSDLKPIWCPGCGDFGVLQAIYRALAAVGRPPHEIAFVSGIGCSSRIPGYTTAYGFNSVHGRALPIAQGIKLANPELLVLCAGGDGDGFSIGGGHVPHAVRRNIDVTYIVMDNQIYGLTKGQLSPTSPRGSRTVTSALGSLETPINPLMCVLSYGAGFVAQGTPADMAGLAEVIERAIRYPGFSFVNVQSPCVTYGEDEQQIKAQKVRMRSLASLGHDATHRLAALDLAQSYGAELYTGIFYENPSPPPTFEALVRERHAQLQGTGPSRDRILELLGATPPVPPAQAPVVTEPQAPAPAELGATRSIDVAGISLRDALDLAIAIEEEAKDRYRELADSLQLHHNPEVAEFFRFMAENEERHQAQLTARRKETCGDAPASVKLEMIFEVEAPTYDQARAFMGLRRALEAAKRSEEKAYAFFDAALGQVRDPEVRAIFEELREEERDHCARVEAHLAELPPEPATPIDPEDFADEPVSG